MTDANHRCVSGIVLAGTYPWNYPGFDSLMPRTLLPIANRPLISYALAWLQDAGIRRIAVCGNRDTGALRHAVGQQRGDSTIAYYEDRIPRGAAGSLRDAASVMNSTTFVIAEGTAIPSGVSLPDLIAAHRSSNAAATVVVHADGRPTSAAASVMPTGVYVFERRVLDFIPQTGFCDIKEYLIGQLYAAGERVLPYNVAEPCSRVLSPSTYLAVNAQMIESLGASAASIPGYIKSGDCLVHEQAIIGRNVVFLGPSIVGPGARIDSGALIVGPTSIGREAAIREGAVVSRSAIWRRAAVGANANADCAIVADGAAIPLGNRVARTIVRPTPLTPARPATTRVARVLTPAQAGLWRRLGVMLNPDPFRSTS